MIPNAIIAYVPRPGLLDLPDSTPELATSQLDLKPPETDDGPALRSIYNEPDVLAALNRTQPLTEENMATAFETWPKLAAAGSWYSFVIHLRTTGEVIGLIELHHISARQGTAELTIFIGSAQRGRRYGLEAVKGVLNWGINDLGLSRIDGVVMPGNVASIALLNAAGMTDQGERMAHTSKGEPLVARVFTCLGKGEAAN